MSMFRSAKTQIAHNATFGSLAGNKDLKQLQDAINAEKSLIQAWQQLIVDCERSADALKGWGAGEGEDLSDTLTASQTLFFQFCSAVQQIVQHEEAVRGHLKAIRSKEEALDELRKQRRATAAKEDSADRKLAKMGPENKNLGTQTQLLTSLRQEIRVLDSQIMTDEAALSDFKRSTVKTLMGLKFGGLQELSEKGALVGNYGKMVIQNISLETTQPGLPRAFYGGREHTKAAIVDVQGALSRISFSTAPSFTTGINAPIAQYPIRQDSMAPSFAESVDTASQPIPHIPDQAPSLAPLDRGPSLNMGPFLANNNNGQMAPPALDTREFGAMPPPDPNSATSSHFRAPAMHDSPSLEGPHSPTHQKTAAATLGSRIAGGFKSGAGKFATFPVKVRQRTGSTVSGASQATEPVHSLEPSNITTASATSYSPTAYETPSATSYQPTSYTPTTYDAHNGASISTDVPYSPTTYKPESPLPPVPQGQIPSGGIHGPQVYSPQPQHGYPIHALDDRPPSLDATSIAGPSESFSTSIAAALSRGFDSDDGVDSKPGARVVAPVTSPPPSHGPAAPGAPPGANRGYEPPPYSHNQGASSVSSPPPMGDHKGNGYAPPLGPPPVQGQYAPPPGPPPHLAAQYSANELSSPPPMPHIAVGGQSGYPPGAAPPTLPPMRFSVQERSGGWNPSEHLPTPPPAQSLSAAPPTQSMPHSPMPVLNERPTTESVLGQQEAQMGWKAKPPSAEEEESQLSYMSPPPAHAQMPSDDTTDDDHADKKDRHVRFGAVSDVDEELEKRESQKAVSGEEDGHTRKRQTMFAPHLASEDTEEDEGPLPSPFEMITPPPTTGTISVPQPNNRAITPEMDEKSLNAAAAREVGRELDSLNFQPPAGPQITTVRPPPPRLPPVPAFDGGQSVPPVLDPAPPPPAPPSAYSGPNTGSPTSMKVVDNGQPPLYTSPPHSPTGTGTLPPPPSISLPRPGISPNPSLTSYHTPPEEFTPTQVPIALPTIRNAASSSSLTGSGSAPGSPTGGGRINAGAFRRAQNRNFSGAEGSPRLGLADISPLSVGKRSLPTSPYPQRPAAPLTEESNPPTQPPTTAPLNVPSVGHMNPSGDTQGLRPKSTASTGSDFEDDYITSYMSTSNEERSTSAGYGASKFATNLEGGNDSGLR